MDLRFRSCLAVFYFQQPFLKNFTLSQIFGRYDLIEILQKGLKFFWLRLEKFIKLVELVAAMIVGDTSGADDLVTCDAMHLAELVLVDGTLHVIQNVIGGSLAPSYDLVLLGGYAFGVDLGAMPAHGLSTTHAKLRSILIGTAQITFDGVLLLLFHRPKSVLK